MLIINEERLLKRIHTLGAVGLDAEGTCHILIAAGRSDRTADFGSAVPALPPPMRIRRGAISCPAG